MLKEMHHTLNGKDTLDLFCQLRQMRHPQSLLKIVTISNPSDPNDTTWYCSLSPYYEFPSLIATSTSSAADSFDMVQDFILLDHMGFVAESDIHPGSSEVISPLDFDDYPVSSIFCPDVLAALEEQPPTSPVPPL
jgi:hypothetical protein